VTENIVSCKKCRHVRRDWSHFPFSIGSPYAWACDRVMTKEEMVLDPVNGRQNYVKPKRKSCVMARSKYGECGEQGSLWEPKHKRDFLVYLKRV
jgi:hypothetical protein